MGEGRANQSAASLIHKAEKKAIRGNYFYGNSGAPISALTERDMLTTGNDWKYHLNVDVSITSFSEERVKKKKGNIGHKVTVATQVLPSLLMM